MFYDVQTTQARQLLTQLRRSLEDLSAYQARIGTSRKELLVKRERLRTAGRKVHLKRVEAGDAEARFMNSLREFVNEYDDVLSSSLFEAYDEVAQIRDDLGEMEEDYLQSERDLTGEEWKYLDQEDTFYQFDIHSIIPESIENVNVHLQDQRQRTSLFPSPPPPPPPSVYPRTYSAQFYSPFTGHNLLPPPPPPPPPPVGLQLAAEQSSNLPQRAYTTIMTEVDTLRGDFDELREQQAQNIHWHEGDEVLFEDGVDEVSEADSSPFTKRYFELLHDISTREAEAIQYRVMGLVRPDGPTTLARRNSDTVKSPKDTALYSARTRRAKSKDDASFTDNDPATKAKIREWSLQYLKNSAVEKQLYQKTLEEFGIFESATNDWQGMAEEYWDQDSLSETGDSADHNEPSVNDASHAVHLSNDGPSLEPCYSGLSSSRDISGYESHQPKDLFRTSISITVDSPDSNDSLPLLLPPSSLVDKVSGRAVEGVLPEDAEASNWKDDPIDVEPPEPKECSLNNRNIKQIVSSILANLLDEPERKDSVISEHQKQVGKKPGSRRVQHNQEIPSDFTAYKAPHSTKLKLISESVRRLKNEVHDDRSFSVPIPYISSPDVREEITVGVSLSAIKTTDSISLKANGRMRLLSKSVSEHWTDTMSRTRRLWGSLPMNRLKRSKSNT